MLFRSHFVHLTSEAKHNLQLWLEFLQEHNGKSFLLSSKITTNRALCLFTDSSGKIGYGALFNRSWFNGRWPDSWKEFPVTVLEFYPIVAGVMVWGGDCLANHRIEFVTDNEALVSIINNQTSKNRQVMFLLRKLILHCLKRHNCFTCSWLKGTQNV